MNFMIFGIIPSRICTARGKLRSITKSEEFYKNRSLLFLFLSLTKEHKRGEVPKRGPSQIGESLRERNLSQTGGGFDFSFFPGQEFTHFSIDLLVSLLGGKECSEEAINFTSL